METTQREKKERYQIYLLPSLRRKLRKEAFDREVSISALIHEAVSIGLCMLTDGKPPRPTA